MNVSKKHGLKIEELKKIVLDTGMNDIYFVVPHTQFDDYPKQNLLTGTTTVTGLVPRELSALAQYVLCIDLQKKTIL